MIRPTLRYSTTSLIWCLLLIGVLPLVGLAAAGLVSSWREGWLIPMLLVWLAVTLLAWIALMVWQKRYLRNTTEQKAGTSQDLPDSLAPRTDWTAQDTRVFQSACERIDSNKDASLDPNVLRERALDVVLFVAKHYKGDRSNAELAFTLPEGLLMLSVASERYRSLILTHVPFADRITVAGVFGLAQQRSRIERGATWFNRLRRGARLVNPVSAVISEAREQFTGRVLSQVNIALRRDLVRLSLQEVAQVAIDLYAGHLHASDHDLHAHRSQAATDDDTREPSPAEPIRVVIVGQPGAGKSSLVNALINELVAEVDVLPTTDRLTTHALTIEGLPPLRLVDTPGLDSTSEAHQLVFETIKSADLVVWVARANQPGREPDARLCNALRDHELAAPERRTPPAIMVLTHVDQLAPRNEWSPPYVLDGNHASDSNHDQKTQMIAKALASAQSGIGLGTTIPAIPARLDSPDYYNIDTISNTIAVVTEDALLAQMNRKRIDYREQSGGWRKRLSQSRNLASGLLRLYARKE